MKNKKASVDIDREIMNAAKNRVDFLEQETKNKDLFLAALIHEIKTPLTTILGYASLLQGFQTDARETKQALQKISSESKRLERLMQKLKCVFGLPDAEPLKPQIVSVSFLFEQLKNITDYMLLKRRQHMVLDSKTVGVTLDPELFLIALKNLVENASNASKDKAVIHIHVSKKEQSVVFCVEDHGCGMEQEQADQLFNRSERPEGNSIGIILCNAIIKLHGARLHIESEQEKGTKVLIVMPQS